MRINTHVFNALVMLFCIAVFAPLPAFAEDIDTSIRGGIGFSCGNKSDGTYTARNGVQVVCKGGRNQNPDVNTSYEYKETCVGYGCSGSGDTEGSGTGTTSGTGSGSGTSGTGTSSGSSGTGSGSGTSGTGTSSGSSGTGSGSGTSGTGNSSNTAPSPSLPSPSLPSGLPSDITPEEAAYFNERLKALKELYLNYLAGLKKQLASAKVGYVGAVLNCEDDFAKRPWDVDGRENCLKGALEGYEKIVKEITEAINKVPQNFNQAVQNVIDAINAHRKNVNVDLPNPPTVSGKDSSSNSAANGANGNNGTGGDTYNNSTTTNNDTTVVNNNTTVNNSSGGGGKSGTNGNSGNSISSGSGQQGNVFSEFCNNNPNFLFCSKLNEREMNEAATIGNDIDFSGSDDMQSSLDGIGKQIEDYRNNHTQSGLKAYVYKQFVGHETASCPPPIQFTVMGKTVLMPYDFFCNFLLMIRPFIIGCSALVTLFFVVRNLR